MKTSTERVIAFRESQSKLGRRKREAYLTDGEWALIKEEIKLIRDKKENTDAKVDNKD